MSEVMTDQSPENPRERSEKSGLDNFNREANFFMRWGSVAAGAYHGYCDAQGIEFDRENLEVALTYGPTVVRGAIGGLVDFAYGAENTIKEWAERNKSRDGLEDDLEKDDNNLGFIGNSIGTIVGLSLGGAICVGRNAVIGATQTAIGYGVGYVAGWAMR
jgi:hypothetical protein